MMHDAKVPKSSKPTLIHATACDLSGDSLPNLDTVLIPECDNRVHRGPNSSHAALALVRVGP